MRTWAILGLVVSLFASTAHAGRGWDDDRDRHHQPKWQQKDYAVIRSVQPRYEQISQPRQECRSEWVTETVAQPSSPHYGGAILGGAAGGAIGTQVGKGRGRDVAIVAGTLLGAMIGDHVADPTRSSATTQTVNREVQRCREVNDYRQQLRDYRVDYEYRSQIYSTTMQRYPGEPGSRLPVRVLVELDD
ncbi:MULTISPECIES: glycine zipper 2TM domain-containing protein [Deefgea]|uniref:Glycine zipper 2TM domain-containing protein n=1 Tax=Deefgea chitinilytica TaxID=570276 RepID=A0ABS2CFB7_9NEIS|nr:MULTISPECIES: glycine zipper 2TM domain-containing protein [Deefgea]MBM5572849.1 glycine zipper 2TM domain-containing protein [Deefgea chitinilytica]MBM9890086.1 glycine zipper 2TM domain-containing protein [Deefgea sp. CFH1-16]